MNLGFGYGRGVPEHVHTAWGARLIVTQDGTTDLLPTRQDLVEKDETTREELIAWLNGGGIRDVRLWIEGLLRDYTMNTRKGEEFRAEFDGGGRAVANTNGSAGYCYVAVWLDKHDERPTSIYDDTRWMTEAAGLQENLSVADGFELDGGT